jgi:purine-binding chemotaxis protein CheW
MTKRIRYSEFGELPEPSKAAEPMSVMPVPAPEPVQPPAPAVNRPKRVSTPVEFAKALAAQRAIEAATAANDPATIAASEAVTIDFADVLVFRIGAERFAVDLMAVDEVIDLPVIHHVPEMPPAMLGVVTVRGSLTPVYSPNASLGMPLGPSDAVLIFRKMGARVGVLIDDVEDAMRVDLRELRKAPTTERDDSLVLGVVRHEGVLLALVDADALIAACQSAAILETV